MPALFTAEALWSLRRVSPPAVARDGSCCVTSVRSTDPLTQQNTSVLYRVDRARPGEATAITAEGASSVEPAISRDGRSLAFVRKPLGAPAERAAQLHVMPLDRGGEARVIGDFPLGVSDPRWFADGERIAVLAPVYAEAPTLEATRERLRATRERAATSAKAYATEERVFRLWDRWLTDREVPHLFEVTVATGAVRDRTPSLEAWFDLMGEGGAYDVSPDGTEAVFSAYVHRAQHQRVRFAIYRVRFADGAIECLTADHVGDDLRPRYAPDGRSIVYGAKRDVAFCSHLELRRRSLVDGSEQTLAPDFEYDADEWEFASEDMLVGSAAVRGRTVAFSLSLDDNSIALHPLPRGSVHGVRPTDDGALWCSWDSLDAPPEIAVLPAPHFALERLSRFNDESLAQFELGAARERTFAGADGDPVQAWVLEPPPSAVTEARPRTLVHLIHGGPFGYLGDQWTWRWNAQVFAARGHAVAMVNFHGSASFGEAFSKSILGEWGDRPAQDVLLATDALAREGLFDASSGRERVAIAGGSFGGYLASWLVTQTDRFRCAIAHAAVTDFTAMLGSDFAVAWNIEMGCWPWDDPDAQRRFDRYDPMRAIRNVDTPVLVVHGAMDYRVPYAQGLELYGALKARGVAARLVVYPNENHWILQRANSVHWYGELLSWLDRYLLAPA
ncbi:MAG: S9 family peptidase [Myxococcales bacterium]|nr:S9 family peptidase [Myxococcales bacterium]